MTAAGGGFGGEWQALIVNDGSADGTREAAMGHPAGLAGRVEVIDHETNRGLARAMDTGIRGFLERSAPGDELVTMDADDTHDPEWIPAMLERLRGGADVVIASRFAPGGREVGVSGFRRFLSRGALVFMSLAAPVRGVRDYSCGFRVYAREPLARAAAVFDPLIESAGFSVMAELLVKLNALGARVEETPFTLRYDRKVGPSKIRMANAIGGYFKLWSTARRARAAARKGAGR